MAEKRTRRRFTAEFKAQAVQRLPESGKGLGEVATELGRTRPRPGPAWKGSSCARPRDVLIPSLHSLGGSPSSSCGPTPTPPPRPPSTPKGKSTGEPVPFLSFPG